MSQIHQVANVKICKTFLIQFISVQLSAKFSIKYTKKLAFLLTKIHTNIVIGKITNHNDRTFKFYRFK